jgi:hypothetical protein
MKPIEVVTKQAQAYTGTESRFAIVAWNPRESQNHVFTEIATVLT